MSKITKSNYSTCIKKIIVLIYYLVEVEPIAFIVTDIYKFFCSKTCRSFSIFLIFLIDLLSFKAFWRIFFLKFSIKILIAIKKKKKKKKGITTLIENKRVENQQNSGP